MALPSPDPLPSPTSVPPAPTRGAPPAKPTKDPLEPYQKVAETVGMVPSLRIKDNVIQAVVVVAGMLIGAGIGAIIAVNMNAQWWFGAIGGAVGGMVLATLVSGLVLMILGWVRALKK